MHIYNKLNEKRKVIVPLIVRSLNQPQQNVQSNVHSMHLQE